LAVAQKADPSYKVSKYEHLTRFLSLLRGQKECLPKLTLQVANKLRHNNKTYKACN